MNVGTVHAVAIARLQEATSCDALVLNAVEVHPLPASHVHNRDSDRTKAGHQ